MYLSHTLIKLCNILVGMNRRIAIALVGDPSSGKTTLARYLEQKHGFFYFEGSDYLRLVARQRDVELTTREEYSDFHRQLQLEFGPSVIADYILARPEERITFAGMRSTQNAQKFQSEGGVVVALRAPIETRFNRRTLGGIKHEATLEAFRLAEEAQYSSPDHLGADLLATMDLADFTLDTSRPIEQTYQELTKIVDSLL
jgi:cytidylate kinase